MTDSETPKKDQDDLQELLDLLEKLVELPSHDSVSVAGIRAAYRRKLFRHVRPQVTTISDSQDSLWEMLHRERTDPLKRVLNQFMREQGA